MSGARSELRQRAGVLVVLAIALLGSGLAPTAAAAPVAPEAPLGRVLVESVAPFVLGPDQPLVLSGRVVNDSDLVLGAVHLRTRAQGRPIVTRSGLASALTDADPLGALLDDVDLGRDLPPHSSVSWEVTIPAGRLGADASSLSVYLAGVEARAQVGDGERRSFARARVPVPVLPAGARFQPTRLALVWPLLATPHRGPAVPFLDDSLGEAVSEGGRLDRLLLAGSTARRGVVSASQPPAAAPAAPPPAPPRVTWAVDPALLQGAVDLADGYQVLSRSGARPGEHSEDAQRWVDSATTVLRAAADDGRLLTVPYADPDVVALSRYGLGPDVGAAQRRGDEVTRDVLDLDAQDSVLWAPGGYLDAGGLEVAAATTARAVLLRDDALAPIEPATYTLDAHASVPTTAGQLDVLLADSVLSDVLTGASSTPGSDLGPSPPSGATELAPDGEPLTDAALLQRFVSETALITSELPSRSRTIVVTPPRHWSPSRSFADALLNSVSASPWLTLVSLGQAATAPEADVERAALTYSPAAAARELSRGFLADPRHGVAALRQELRDLRAVLATQATAATLALDFALLRAESAAWRDDPARGAAVRAGLESALHATTGKVGIVSKGLVTLTSKRGAIPITIENELDYPVNIRLRLRAQSRARLSAPDEERHTIEAHRKRTLQIEAEAFTSGVFTVQAQLLTPDDEASDRRPYGPPVELRVRSTAYGAVAVIITAAGGALLGVAIVIRLTRRLIRYRRTQAA